MTDSHETRPADGLPFGPALIGQTEKTLQSLLRRALADTGLNEPLWVTMRLATMLDGQVDHEGLIAAVADRARFTDTAAIIDHLTERNLLDGGKPTSAGHELVAGILATIETTTGSVWRDLPPDDVETTTRVLNEVLRRARQLA